MIIDPFIEDSGYFSIFMNPKTSLDFDSRQVSILKHSKTSLFLVFLIHRCVRRLGVLTLESVGEEESMPQPQPPSW